MSADVPPRPRREAQRKARVSRRPELREYSLELPGTPPSFNAVGLHSHWSRGRKVKQEWQRMIETMLLKEQVPRGLQSVAASAVVNFKQRRRRDEGNWKAIIEKACGDALVRANRLADDTPDYYRFGSVELLAPSEVPSTIIHLVCELPPPDLVA